MLNSLLKSPLIWGLILCMTMLVLFALGLHPEEMGRYQVMTPTTGSIVLMIAATLGAFILVISIWIEFCEHSKDLGNLRAADKKIANAEDYRSEVKKNYETLRTSLKETLGDLPENLMNQDNPVAALVGGLMKDVAAAERDVRDTKDRKANIGASIESRTVSPFSFIVDIYGAK